VSRLIDKRSPFEAPNFDIFAPARLSDERGYIVSDILLDDARMAYHPWMGVSTLGELARRFSEQIGMVDAAEFAALTDRLTELDEEVERLRAVEAENQEFRENLAGLTKEGFLPRKVMGPKKKVEAAV
jgi:hypothetical protein